MRFLNRENIKNKTFPHKITNCFHQYSIKTRFLIRQCHNPPKYHSVALFSRINQVHVSDSGGDVVIKEVGKHRHEQDQFERHQIHGETETITAALLSRRAAFSSLSFSLSVFELHRL